MNTVCPNYTEYGFCINGTNCTLPHIDNPAVPATATPNNNLNTPLSNDINGVMLKTSFGNLTLDDISSTPSFIPSSQLQNPSHFQNSPPHFQNSSPILNQNQVVSTQPVQFDIATTPEMQGPMYFLPSTRLDIPSRAFVPNPVHLDRPSMEICTGNQVTDELRYQQTLTSLYMDSKLPDVGAYYCLYPLEHDSNVSETLFPYPSVNYRAYSTVDGLVYVLRRFKNYQVTGIDVKKIVDKWKSLSHPNIVGIHDAFITKQFGDTSFVIVYDFLPGARTLKQLHFQGDNAGNFNIVGKGYMNKGKNDIIQESLLWNYIIQITSAMRLLHNSNLYCRVINPSKIIVTHRNRIRLNCIGAWELLSDDANKSYLIPRQQQEDLVDLGKLIVCLACSSLSAILSSNLPKSSELITSSFTADVKQILQYLLQKTTQPKKINDLMPMIGARFYAHIEKLRLQTDITEGELMKELENGRLFRLLCKINAVLDRPEHLLDPNWGDTEERHILKLFRNYIFHKTDDLANPWVDLPHIILCLNKLDTGSHDRILLTSPHEQNAIICEYKDIKYNFDKCFNELFPKPYPS